MSIWLFQTAMRFTDVDIFAKIILCAVLMFVVWSLKTEDEAGYWNTGVFQSLFAAFLYLLGNYSILNYASNAQRQDDRPTVNRTENKKKKVKLDNTDRGGKELLGEIEEKLEEKKKFKAPPPVSVEDKKKKKKGKKSTKKNVCKENKEPAAPSKERTKVYDTMDTARVLNMTHKGIYDALLLHRLTDQQLRINNYPQEGYTPRNLVRSGSSSRVCVRCGVPFEVLNGVYLSSTRCLYHPRKAVVASETSVRRHPCCSRMTGDMGCTEFNFHVTQQHGPRALTKTASRRHVRRDLQHRIFSLDCEMSYTTGGLEVTRIGLVDIDGLTVYDSYVKPRNKILDYNTLYSGVEKRHLENITIDLEDVKKILNNFIHEDTILVGHALNNDLAALGIIHKTVVDTSVLYADAAYPFKKKSLKSLAADLLNLVIQNDPSGHDCIDDARASLRLALLKIPSTPPSRGRPFVPVENTITQPPLVENRYFPYGQEQQPQPMVEIQNFKFPPRWNLSYNIFRPEDLQRWCYDSQQSSYIPYIAGV